MTKNSIVFLVYSEREERNGMGMGNRNTNENISFVAWFYGLSTSWRGGSIREGNFTNSKAAVVVLKFPRSDYIEQTVMRILLVLQLHVIRIRPMKVRSLGAIAVHGCSVKANEFLSREQAYRLSVVRRLYNSCLQLAYTILGVVQCCNSLPSIVNVQ